MFQKNTEKSKLVVNCKEHHKQTAKERPSVFGVNMLAAIKGGNISSSQSPLARNVDAATNGLFL
jgi:hypothetical protein